MASLKQTILAALVTTSSINTHGHYRSRPDLAPPQLNITVPAAHSNGSEYVFIAPYSLGGTLERPGPYIYRKDGDLVWAGTGYYAGFVANFHPTTYQGKPVLQAFQGSIDGAHGEGFGQHLLLDQSYQHVVTSTAGNHRVSSIHEFNVIQEETALIEVFYTTPANLSAYGGNSSQLWLGNGMFQELEIATGELIFEWNALEHVDPSESLVTLGSTNANSGLSSAQAWDYFHINSLDKNEEGDYLLSSRHTSTIFKINGTDGSIIWRLGGRYPSFAQIGNWTFGFQHHARWHPQLSQPETEVISFFDNSGDGTITFNNVSRALVVQINQTDRTATVLRKATAPYALQAQSQGNTQLLSDDRIFVNWGSEGAFTEFGADNEILYHAFLPTGSVSYRGYLSNWTGTPKETPALVALKTASNTVELYVSWNGDTETSAWRFFCVNGKTKTRVGQVSRDSFETAVTWKSTFALSSSARFIAEAVGPNGESLAQTRLTAVTDSI
ncbi:Guanylate cyclase activating protein 2 [Penicillium digitatum]|uniref:Arylsulfotransferase n=3 Tax=Penicillium digitatum TaxID=36651 RepID=K9G6I7_PEND2|nr:hypothetical protein PDIP_66430 [Penicillium digitatum Pd1]EKV09132.1 hypothetical protein PDIP_66430 [Penicillium digitatum Pd1]EKV10398.1 hypothetical protein PDIG_56870 [Penicillium digitatum PHI26]KAG0158562.1 hypothetical protein PDIDSM_6077 [Penicillium digitatum]QQK41944.1 Guanylate cyclase activating protein 2 [Penicillium digitatum]